MKIKKFKESNDKKIMDFKANFCTMGFSDISTAIDVVEESEVYGRGYSPDLLYEALEDFADSVGYNNLDDVDVVAMVYDDILQHARGEIEKKTNYDFLNDFRGGTEIYVAGNYMATSYDYSEEAIEELNSVLEENKLSFKNFDNTTQWFLSELGI